MKLSEEKTIQIGKLGTYRFRKGFYIYVGSAMGKYSTSLFGRINRHISEQKKKFWHIDFLLMQSKIMDIFWVISRENIECELNKQILNCNVQIPVNGFGSSDCKYHCKAHLSFTTDYDKIRYCIKQIISKYGEFGIFNLARPNNTN